MINTKQRDSILTHVVVGTLFLLLCVSAIAPFLSPTDAQAAGRGDGKRYLNELSQAFQDVAEAVTPAVVHIQATMEVPASPHGRGGMPGFDFLRPPDNQPRQRSGIGSGVIVDAKNGYIVTNHHVVADAVEIEVTVTANGRSKTYNAELVGEDPGRGGTDLAVLKIDAENLVEAELGDSDDVKVGEWVMAIGNPFGLDQSVTAGIVSYKGRNTDITSYSAFIQTDAAVNPGNSGGPLVDLDGRIIGINIAIVTGGYQQSNAGVSFAIPVNLVRDVMTEIIEQGSVERGWLGIEMREVTDEFLKEIGFKTERGAFVRRVFESSPAEDAGLEAGDLIAGIDGVEIKDSGDLMYRVADMNPGVKIQLEVKRIEDDEERTVSLPLTLGSRTEGYAANTPGMEPMELGLALSPLTPEIIRRSGFDEDETGVLVTNVLPGSPADEAKLLIGDIIKEVNREEVGEPQQVYKIIRNMKVKTIRGKKVKLIPLLVQRDSHAIFLTIEKPE